MVKNLIAVGTDYELFVRKLSNDVIVSAIPLVETNKEGRISLRTCDIHHDNVLVEVNTVPATSPGDFYNSIKNSLDDLGEFLHKTGHTYVIKDSYFMPEEQLRHVDALEFGCVEDTNVITQTNNKAPSAWIAKNQRTAGGHVHVSYTFKNRKEYVGMAILLSTALSLGTTIMGDSKERRNIYGKAHSVRFKEYGVEVRSPSNIWLSNDSWISWVWSTCARVTQTSPGAMAATVTLCLKHKSTIAEAINTGDREGCGALLHNIFKVLKIFPPDSAYKIKENSFEYGFALKCGVHDEEEYGLGQHSTMSEILKAHAVSTEYKFVVDDIDDEEDCYEVAE